MNRLLELGVILLIVAAVVALGWYWNKRAEDEAHTSLSTQQHHSIDATGHGS